MGIEEPSLDFRCSHCETTEKTFSSLERQEEKLFKIMVRNLPPGLTQKGIVNLFLTVGTPISCAYNPGRNHAFVEFESLNEAELAYRDLHQKPPYNLKITRSYQHFDSITNKRPQVDANLKDFKSWDFSPEENPVEFRQEDDGEKMSELIAEVRSFVGTLGYDPSIRMRQKMLDFKTGTECVSKGRGYVNMGKEDRFVGGLQKSVFSSKNGKARDAMRYQCENCESTTTKVCSNCNASYCSLSCLRESSTDHMECFTRASDDEVKGAAVSHISSSTAFKKEPGPGSGFGESFPKVTFTSGCSLLMTSYSSMQTVFLRRTDGEWDDRFTRLCNEVALQVMKGERLQKMPEEGEVVAAKYYEDLGFYRARVLSKSESKTSVLFIDFGNTQETLLEDLKPLPERLRSVPGQALQVRLKDVSEDSSLESVDYYNALTARRVPLVPKFESSTNEIILVEKDSNTEVNKTVIEKALPSWRRDDFSFSKLGENYFLQSLSRTKLEVSKTCSLIVSHFDENEFRECEVFWVTQPNSDEYFHVKTRMRQGMTEYCSLLKDDFYLPRVNELCLAKENDEWHRCVNLQNYKTTCCLFFLDDGHSSYIDTKNIRKMIQDFTEAPSQAVCCILPGDSRMKTDNELRSEVIQYLKDCVGQTVDSVSVLKLMGDGYCLSFPRIKEILSRSEP